MKFNLNHDPNNKTLVIPRAALQLPNRKVEEIQIPSVD